MASAASGAEQIREWVSLLH